MINIIKKPKLLTVLIAVFFAVGVFAVASSVSAFGGGGGGDCPGGCSGGGGGGGGGGSVNPPTCDIVSNLSTVRAGSEYRITWEVVSMSPVNVYINDAHVNKTGSATYTFGSNSQSETFVLEAENAGGWCRDSVRVTREEPPEPPEPPVCEIESNLKTVRAGSKYTISWDVESETAVNVYINGAHVNKTGSATYTFDGSHTKETFTLTANNAGGDCTDKVVVKKEEEPKVARCDAFNASPKSLPYGGGNVKLTWKTTNADSVRISGIGDVADDGSTTIFVGSTKTFTLTAYGDGGNDDCSVKVKVAAPEAASCDAFSAFPTKLPYGGGEVQLKWNTSDATSVSIDNGIGSVSADGSKVVEVTKTTTFKLTAKGTGGNDSCTVKVTVAAPDAASCDAFNASPKSLPYGGGNVKLTWNTTDADSVSIDNGIGSVSADGSKTVQVTKTTTFVLTAKGAGGDDSCTTKVTVGNEPPEKLSCDYFDADPSHVEPGEDFTLKWETTGATHVSINNGIGSVDVDGIRFEDADEDTTYILTATDGSETVTCKTKVYVDEEDDDDDDLRCELDISDSRIDEGDSVELEWDNEGDIEDILLEDDHGNVLVDTDEGDDYDVDRDDIRVKPTEDTEYTLTVYGEDGGRERCDVDVEVDEDDDVSVTSYRDQEPLVAGISLTNVPYTGFEAGPIMTALFYTLIAVWGLAVAYILVVKKGSVLGFALAGNAPTPSPIVASAPAAAEEEEVSFAPANLPVAEEMDAVVDDENTAIENKAHESRALLSTEAIHFIAEQEGTLEEKLSLLERGIANARAMFPAENGWVALNKERLVAALG